MNTIGTFNEALGLLEEHAGKQVQLHAVAEHVIKKLRNVAPPEFGQTLRYGKTYFSFHDDCSVTMEPFYDGKFIKFINNDGNIQRHPQQLKICVTKLNV